MSIESDSAHLLVQELLAAEKPHHKATLPILAYSTRSLGNALSDLEDELMPDVIKASMVMLMTITKDFSGSCF